MIYLDNSATTRISEEALARYCEVSREQFGNPSSLHAIGKAAEDILKDARCAVRAAIGAKGGTVVFTASGTEANNLAIIGRAHAKARYRGAKLLTSAGEHASVTAPLSALAAEGMKVAEIPTVGGRLDLAALEAMLTPDTVLVTVMLVNNETGALYDLRAASDIIKRKAPDCALHADATQALFKTPIDVRALGVRLMTLSSHKVEGPKGVGALWIDDSLIKEKGIAPMVLGGGQEGGLRSGTENVPGIAAFATACRIGAAEVTGRIAAITALRERLLAGLSDPAFAEVTPVVPAVCAPHILTLLLPSIKSEVMLHFLSADGISVSSGSACSSHGHVGTGALSAFGIPEGMRDFAIRVSLSHRNTEADIDALLASLQKGLSRLARKK